MLAALRSRTFSLSSPTFSSPSSSSLKQWNLGLLLGLNRAFSTSLVEQNNNSVISDRKGLLKLEEVEKVLSDVKADNIQIIPMRKSDDFADFMVVATGRSPWHVRNIAQALIYKVKQKQKGAKRMLLPSVEGQEGGKWVVIDSGTLIIHALDEKVRGYYDLERLWTSETSYKEQTPELEKAFVKVRRTNNSKKKST